MLCAARKGFAGPAASYNGHRRARRAFFGGCGSAVFRIRPGGCAVPCKIIAPRASRRALLSAQFGAGCRQRRVGCTRPCLHSPREPRFERKSPDGRWSGDSRDRPKSVSGNTVEGFDELAGDFHRNPSGRADFARVAALARCPTSRYARPYAVATDSAGNGQNRQRRGRDDYVNRA